MLLGRSGRSSRGRRETRWRLFHSCHKSVWVPSQVKAPFLLLILRFHRVSTIGTFTHIIGKFPLTLFTLLHVGPPYSIAGITGDTWHSNAMFQEQSPKAFSDSNSVL